MGTGWIPYMLFWGWNGDNQGSSTRADCVLGSKGGIFHASQTWRSDLLFCPRRAEAQSPSLDRLYRNRCARYPFLSTRWI